MNRIASIKVAAATATIIGVGLAFLEKMNAPHVLLAESSPDYPEWLSWVGFLLPSAAALLYIGADVIEHRKKK